MEPIRLLIVDDNQETRFFLNAFFAKQEGIEVAGLAANGLEALSLIEHTKADIMLMDIVMPQMDGFALLSEMRKHNLPSMPKVIAVSSLARDDFIQRAMELGVRYYVVKPYDIQMLLQRVREIAGQEARRDAPLLPDSARQSLDERLSSLFLTIGIPAHIKGYQFLRAGVKMVVENHEVINRITKDLYPGIAVLFHTSSSKVERAIRHAIEVAWARGRVEMLNKTFGCKVVTREDRPTNGEFIAMIADKIACERSA